MIDRPLQSNPSLFISSLLGSDCSCLWKWILGRTFTLDTSTLIEPSCLLCLNQLLISIALHSVGHKGKFGHEFMEFELLPNRTLRYANNSNYKNDVMIRKEGVYACA